MGTSLCHPGKIKTQLPTFFRIYRPKESFSKKSPSASHFLTSLFFLNVVDFFTSHMEDKLQLLSVDDEDEEDVFTVNFSSNFLLVVIRIFLYFEERRSSD